MKIDTSIHHPTVVIDVETTTFNKGHPFDPRNRLISYAYYDSVEPDAGIVFKYHTDPDFKGTLGRRGSTIETLVGFHIKFDCHWLLNCEYVFGPAVKIWDCQLAEHILTGQQSPYLSLNEALESYGLPVKLDKVKEYWDRGIDTADIPVDVLEEYNKWDVQMTYELYKMQRSIMSPEQVNLCFVEGEDMKTLIEAERNGIKWDRKNAEILRQACKESLDGFQERLFGYLPDTFNAGLFPFNWDSGDQLSCLLYGGTLTYDYAIPEDAVYKSGPNKGKEYVRNRWHTEEVVFPPRFKPIAGTETKKTKDDPNALVRFYQVDIPTLQSLTSRRKEDKELLELLQKRADKTKVMEMIDSVENTMLKKNWQDDLIHGQYNQNVAITGRLSSSDPNMQNTPPELDQLLVSRYD